MVLRLPDSILQPKKLMTCSSLTGDVIVILRGEIASLVVLRKRPTKKANSDKTRKEVGNIADYLKVIESCLLSSSSLKDNGPISFLYLARRLIKIVPLRLLYAAKIGGEKDSI